MRRKNLYLIKDYNPLMFAEYIQAAMDKATYEIIDDPEPFYGEVPELKGLWATGKTLEECRKNLMDALDDWIAAHLAWGYPVPPLEGHMIHVSKEPMAVAD
jgi:predicted RNase H-like HicB family nuclease